MSGICHGRNVVNLNLLPKARPLLLLERTGAWIVVSPLILWPVAMPLLLMGRIGPWTVVVAIILGFDPLICSISFE